MKSIRFHEFGEPSVLKLETVPDPVVGAGQVVVAVKAIGVNPVDGYIRAGKYGPRSFPFTPGFDAAGVIESIGTGVTVLRPGDRVYVYGSISGTYAEKILCDVSQVHPLPDSLSFSQGAALGVAYLTAYFALHFRAQAKPGETLLVHGASGGVGTAAVQLGRMMGMTVIGTAGTTQGLAHVTAQGAHHALAHNTPDYLDQLMKITEGRGANVILEMLANVNLGKDLKILSKFGRVVVIGNRGTIEIDPRDAMSRNASILAMSLFNTSAAELAECHIALQTGLTRHQLIPVIGQEFPLAQAATAQDAVMAPGALGKIVLIP